MDDKPYCKFLLPSDPFFQCPHPPQFNGYCIFHYQKLNSDNLSKWNEGQIENLRRREQQCGYELFKLIERFEKDSSVEFIDLRGFSFPAVGCSREFTKPVSFEFATFNGPANFNNAIFKKGLNFANSVSYEEMDFSKGQFEQADFSRAIFNKPVSFNNVTFRSAVVFNAAKFNGGSLFHQVEFQNDCWLIAAKFGGITYFTEIKTNGTLNFAGSTISGEFHFEGPAQIGDMTFANITQTRDATIIFDKVDLSKVKFIDTNLENINFRDVNWGHLVSKPSMFGMKRKILFDELQLSSPNKKQDFEKVAENYRQLVLNYERKRDFDSAEDFHLGEMEMRRRKIAGSTSAGWKRKIRENVNVYALYKLLSCYGTSY